MKIGVALPNLGPMASAESVRRLARLAETCGLAHIWVGDHIVLPLSPTRSSYAHGSFSLTGRHPILDPLVTLGYAAALTHSVGIGLSVLIAPYRNPIETARMLFTLDNLCDGRLICGLGAGWLEEEFELLGANYSDRELLVDDYAQLFSRLASEDVVTFEGAVYRCAEVAIFPKPVQSPAIPLWIGGNGDRALRRAVRLGDGWQPTALSPEQLAAKHDRLMAELEGAGRQRESIVVSVRISCGQSAGDAQRFGPGLFGSSQEMADSVERYGRAGAEHLILTLRAGSISQAEELVSFLGEEVLVGLQ